MTREIIHISYGALPARFSTQYFNSQTAYFDYSPRAPQPLVDHDVSWQQGIDPNGRDRYTPRWITYDVRSGFAGLRTQDDPEEEGEGVHDAVAAATSYSAWATAPEVMRTGAASTSQANPFRSLSQREARGESFDWDEELDRQFDSDEASQDDNEAHVRLHHVEHEGISRSTADLQLRRDRPWSHRLLFDPHPRSLIPVGASGGLPLDSMPWQSHNSEPSPTESFETYEQGYARAKGWEQEHETLETSFRALMEAADQPQGMNIALQDSDAWSGFSAWNLEQIVDEYPKLARLGWSMGAGKGLGDLEQEQNDSEAEDGAHSEPELRLARIRSMNRALSLLTSVDSLSLLTPVRLPSADVHTSQSPSWTQHLTDDIRQHVQKGVAEDTDVCAAILASQFETATLGARLRSTPLSLAGLVSHLSWRGDTPIGTLGGCLPTPMLAGTAQSAPLDPIEALLAARGYNPRPFQGPDQASQSRLGALNIAKAWTSFSDAPRAPRKLRLGGRPTRKRQGDSSLTQQERSPSVVHPFAMCVSARDSGGEAAALVTQGAVSEWLHGASGTSANPSSTQSLMNLQHPLGRSTFAPLSFPVTAAFPRIWRHLSAQGRPLQPEGTGSTGKARTMPKSLPLTSALSTTPASLGHIVHAQRVLERALGSHLPLSAWGLGGSGSGTVGAAANEESEGRIGGRDGLKELREKVEELMSAYQTEDTHANESDGDGGPGTDEEWDKSENKDEDGLDWS
ncbi:unnamed protein product [Parajaminaea phylloscopi]